MFRLHKVLEWKETQEKEAWAKRLALESRANEMEREIERLRRQRREMPEAPANGDGSETIAELAQWALFAEGLRRREDSLRARLEAFRPELEARILAHLELQREVKGLRKLEERERLRRKKKVEKKQQETIDDVASRMSFPGPGTSFPDSEPVTVPSRADRSPETHRGRDSDPIRGRGT